MFKTGPIKEKNKLIIAFNWQIIPPVSSSLAHGYTGSSVLLLLEHFLEDRFDDLVEQHQRFCLDVLISVEITPFLFHLQF